MNVVESDTAPRTAAVQLRVTVRGPRDESEDLTLLVPRGATVSEFIDQLASRRHLEVAGSGRLTLSSEATGALAPNAQLLEVGLRNGDSLEFRVISGPVGSTTIVSGAADDPAADVIITAGPEAGRRFALPGGAHTLGREEGVAIQLGDPSLSREHLLLTVSSSEIRVRDLNSSNGTAIEGAALPAGGERRLETGQAVRAGRTVFAVVPPGEQAPQLNIAGAVDGRRPHNRMPRIPKPSIEKTIDLGSIPSLTKGFRPPLGASLIPLVIGGVIAFVMKQPVFLLFSAMGPVMAAWTVLADKRSGRAAFKRQSATFTARLETAQAEAEAARATEISERRGEQPDPAELVDRAVSTRRELWERRPVDSDFLSVRLGVATQPSRTRIAVNEGTSAEHAAAAAGLMAEYATVPAVPVNISLPERGVCGLCGSRRGIDGLARWLILQAAVHHSPRELAVAAAVSPRRAADWEWLKWLPHTDPGDPILADTQLACTPASGRAVLRAVAELVTSRHTDLNDRFGLRRHDLGAAVLLLIDESLQIERSQIAPILQRGPAVGVYTIWLGTDERELPGECGAIVRLARDIAQVSVTYTDTGEVIVDVSADAVSPELSETAARPLAATMDSGGVGGRAELPRRVLLPDLLGLDTIDADAIAARWSAPSARRGMRTPLGLAIDGPFEVDLRNDGPHALIAGITGAGKSELLQTLVAGLAATYPPHRVSFLLVDYKGGAAFKDCTDLPHVVGMVTDLDAHLTHRALVSLNAELHRRERILREADARDLAEMERIAPAQALANLVVIIDEFAALAREVPAFVDGLVDVAQRGRSLGVHLVLATQRPGGVVSENIRANTNLRIALRVANAEQSTDVIAAPDAARIPRSMPGRAFARTGANELDEFQSAYVGAPAALGDQTAGIEISAFVFDLASAGRRPHGATTAIQRPLTDLGAVVGAAREATRSMQATIPPSPWLPALAPMLSLEDLEKSADADERRPGVAIIGQVDEPAAQRQWTLSLDLEEDGSVLIYGASGAGKTALLRTLASSLAQHSSPQELQLYALDFASRGLGGLEALPHCGSVIAGDDDERIRRVLRMMRSEIDRRKRLLGEAGALTLEEYASREGSEPLPRLVTLLDSYAGFTSTYDRVDAGTWTDLVPRIVAEGRNVGVHMVITGDRRAAIPPPVTGVTPRKLILRMADDDDYQTLGLDSRAVRGALLPPGRGFVAGGLEFQAALLGGDPASEVQSRALADLGGELTARARGRRAPRISVLPTRLPLAELPVSDRPLTATFGLGDDRLAPVTADLTSSHLVVAGPYKSGRTTALAALITGLAASTPGLEAHLLSPRRTELPSRFAWASVAEGDEQCLDAARRLAEQVAARVVGANPPIIVVVDDGGEIADGPAAAPLETIVRRGRDVEVRVLLGIEAGTARVAYTPWIRELRKDGHGVLLDPDQDLHGDILSIRLPRRTGGALPSGRGYYVRSGTAELVQVAMPE